MADYYPLLVRAISSLPQNTGESRRAVFDRARSALLKQLRSVDPPLPEGEITRERLSLEEAIRRVEADFAPQDNVPEDQAAAEPVPPEAAPEAAPAAEPHSVPAEAGSPEASAPQGVPPADAAPEAEAAGAGEARTAGADARAERESPAERPKGDAAKDTAKDAGKDASRGEGPQGERRPPLRRGEVRPREGAKAAPKAARPGLPPAEEKGPSWKKLALWAALAVLVLVGIGFAVVNRNVLLGGGETQTAASSGASSQVDQPKNADRVATASDDTARRAPPAQGRPTAAGTERAILLEESPGGASPPQSFEGTVTWKTETFEAGHSLPPETGVRGVITIPERQISMEFVLRRNADQSLPASHTIQLQFKLPNDFAFGGIGDIPGVRVKPNQQAQGVPLAGLTVKVNPTLFLVGLSSVPADRQRNITLMQVYPWFDVPLVYDNNKRAVIQFDKGSTGEQVFNEAFSAWGELVERKPAPPPAPEQ